MADETSNKKLVTFLIYSGTCHATLKVLEVLAAAQGTPGNHKKAGSLFARGYHAFTGNLKKEFGKGKLPVILCNLALGMGQSWRSVLQVVHI